MTATAVTTNKTVIVADDTAFVRDRFATALLGAGHTALTVKSAVELLARVRSDLARIDLIVLDLRLPHAGGVDLVRSIRKLDGGKLPILVFSGTIATAEEVRDLAALGVSGYVNEYSAVQHILPSLAPHLFPDNFNRRGSPRVVLGIPDQLSLRQHDCRRAHAQYQQGWSRDPYDEPAASRTPSCACGFVCRDRSATSKPNPASRGAIAGSGWGCSSRKSIRPTRPRSTSSSISTSSRIEKRDFVRGSSFVVRRSWLR